MTRGHSCPRAERARTRERNRGPSRLPPRAPRSPPARRNRSCACTQKPGNAEKGGSGSRATLRTVAVSESRAARRRGSVGRTGRSERLGEARRTRVGQPPGTRLPGKNTGARHRSRQSCWQRPLTRFLASSVGERRGKKFSVTVGNVFAGRV